MKPHIRAATTAGTAYGRKMASRNMPAPYSRPLSSASATMSASSSITGTCTARNSATRPNADQKCGSVNTDP